ncbi:hypothetical protein [Sphingomonas sp. SRS2]|uniref:hypothetical protein n=1 Tax=Sphingomonas sp. SRS2 TaxID=133190 RepID=UPI00061840FD|nr:hypothetical protein [Sphingomonas sp. SRS2]KKC24840.1 hypothetical protein WP12_16505 [Sphingomonas sp. SRS2]
MIPPQILAIGAGVVLLAGLLGGWTVRDWKADADALKAVEARDALRERMQGKVDAGAARYEQARAEAEPATVETRNTIREIYRDGPPIPAECSVPDAVAVMLDAARIRANGAAAGQSGAAMPRPPTDATERP